MRNISIKGLSLVLILFAFGINPLSSQDSLDAVYSQLNLAFAEHSADKISEVLKKQSGSPDYSLYESYALKKTRQLIIDDELEFARQASLAVIDNNLENFDAVDLYSYIDRAILNEQAAKQAEENRARLEAERIAAMNARTKEKIEKSNTYSTVSTASGSSVYINESHRQFSSLTWNFQFGIADVLLQKVTDPASYSSIKYGLLLGLDLLYQTDQYTMGLDVQGDYHMLTMGQGEEEVMYSIRAIPMISFNSISNKVFLRAGFAYYGLGTDGKVETGSVESFPTPVIGIGLDNIKFGETGLQLHYDYCLGHFSMEDVKASMEFGGAVTVPLAINERTKIGVKLGVSDLLFMKQNGIDNRAKAIFAIGVGNVNK